MANPRPSKPFVKGQKRPPGSGRAKGTPNKLTVSMKACLEEALARKGGADYLVKLRPQLLAPLFGKLLPLQIEGGDPNKPVVFRWQDPAPPKETP